MHYLKQFLGFLFSRQMLAFVAMVLLALVIWFVGPLLAVDGLRPLASVGVRVSFIVLLLALGILWLVSGPVSLIGVAALCLLVWHAGPLLALGNAQPLAPAWVRTVIIAVILVACAVYWLYVLWRMLQTDPKMLDKILAFGKDTTQEETAREEIKTVTATVNRAMAQLKGLRARGGALRRLFEGKRYLYELPWYMIVGSPGAGKTTALLNSGLQFPLAREMGHAPRSMVLHAEGGTMHCDWWFTNEAVMIDTAGRYITQDSDAAKDPAEWRGFLGLLRKHRTRAPINGAIVALNAAELLTMSDTERAEHAALVRDRLAELREELGIRFPVYVVVTKMDLLRGFGEYFQSLTSEGRTQTWGFTLPFQGMKAARPADLAAHRDALRAQVGVELGLLKDRLAEGLRARLNEEFDVDRRRRLFALPQELAGLTLPLVQVLDEVFLDSRFDGTQAHNTLRGVYFTSGAQSTVDLPADPDTLWQRLERALGRSPARGLGRRAGNDAAAAARKLAALNTEGEPAEVLADPKEGMPPTQRDTTPVRGQGFFLQDLLTKVIIPEAHLVRPNLRWEFRFRLLRLMGHALAIVIFLWLAGALALSFGNNKQYLAAVGQRAQALTAQVRALYANFKPAGVPDVLNSGRELPGYSGLDVNNPPGSFLYGLYTVPPVLSASAETYASLQDHMLLPPILQRMEAALAHSMKANDTRTAYETLRVYKLLYDKERYMNGGARDVRNWVLKDWETTDSATAFGGRASMVGHVEALFAGDRPLQPASLPNESLVRDVQNFLNTNTSTQRVYERAKAAMLPEAPQEFTLVRAVGPQVGTVFTRAGGLPLEKGVPGLFTYDGYHELFNKRLPEFVGRALEDDAWVMGRGGNAAAFATGQKKPLLDDASDRLKSNPLLEDIRRQYLMEYAQHWESFLESIRVVSSSGDVANTSLGFDLSVLRQLAAPDSPLSRLARTAARETTLSRPLVTRAQEDKSFLDKATDELNKQTREIGKNLGIRPEERLEKQIVDNRFAALREVVTGQPDIGMASAGAAGAKPGLESISGLLNEYYALLVVADTALNSGSLPPGGTEVGARLKLEAGKLPAPFREVLTALAASGGDKVAQGATDILHKQAQAQLDRIMGLMAMQVGGLVDKEQFSLFCTPVINLFERRTDRIELNTAQPEFHLVPDRSRPLDFEVYSVKTITGQQAQTTADMEFRPLYQTLNEDEGNYGRYFSVRREPRLASDTSRKYGTRTPYIGTEVFLSLVDQHEAPYAESIRYLSVRAMLTNRDLPCLVPRNGRADLAVAESIPVAAVGLIRPPSTPKSPFAQREIAWRLIRQLGFNHLPLADMPHREGAQALRDMLRLFVSVDNDVQLRQIESLVGSRIEPVTRRLPGAGPLIYGRGVQCTLSVDEEGFSGASPYLFGLVLEHYLARHVSINVFTQTTLESMQRGTVARWPVRMGGRGVV